MSDPVRKSNLVLGLVGAAAGGVTGFFAFGWIWSQGFYALIIPPVLLGLVAGYCARGRSNLLAIICGIAGFALALFTEWRFRPFVPDRSLVNFLAHVHTLGSVTMIMIVIGSIASYRLALGPDERPRSQ